MKRLLLALLFATLTTLGMAEQRVEVISYRAQSTVGVDDISRLNPPPTVVRLLSQGWRIVHLATSAGGASWPYLVIFVLERPDPVKP